MAELTEVRVPDIGDFSAVEIIEILVAPGDRIEAEQALLTLESEKAAMELPAPAAGTIEALNVSVGDKVSAGDLVATLQPADGAAAAPAAEPASEPTAAGTEASPAAEPAPPAPPAMAPPETTRETAPAPAQAEPSSAPGSQEVTREPRRGIFRGPPIPVTGEEAAGKQAKPHASPTIRRFARELGVDLQLVTGSGRKGRILKSDVQAFVKQRLAGGAAPAAGAVGGSGALGVAPAPQIDFRQFGPTETVTLNKLRRLSAENLHRSWVTAPHVTQFDEADITELEAFRKANSEAAKAAGGKLSILPFLLKASVAALQQFPEVNASLHPDGEQLILKGYFHLGVAVDTPQGLVVPVIRDVDQKGLLDLAKELVEVSDKARARKLSPADMQGGCFTVSSLGGIGGTQFTPIVNTPEVAILGVARAQTKPVWDGQAFQPRLLLPLALSYDHRVVDGALGARFVSYLREQLGDIRRLLL